MREILFYYNIYCGYSNRANKILREIDSQAKINFNPISTEQEKNSIRNEFKKYLNGYYTYPMIFLKNGEKITFFGGYSELKNFLDKNNKNLNYLEKKMQKYLYYGNIEKTN